jgi:hypothetical protein
MKKCTACGETKARDAFSLARKASSGLNSRCKPCSNARARQWRLDNPEKARARVRQWKRDNPEKTRAHRRKERLSKYSLSVEQYDFMFASQGRACAICGASASAGQGFHIDHCHTTGAVRGILCQNCNIGIGNLQDDPEILRRALTYLEST